MLPTATILLALCLPSPRAVTVAEPTRITSAPPPPIQDRKA